MTSCTLPMLEVLNEFVFQCIMKLMWCSSNYLQETCDVLLPEILWKSPDIEGSLWIGGVSEVSERHGEDVAYTF